MKIFRRKSSAAGMQILPTRTLAIIIKTTPLLINKDAVSRKIQKISVNVAEGDTGFFLGHEKLLNLEEKDILPLLKSTCQGGESIYFIGDTMKPIFDRLCNDIAVFCYGVGWHNTFGVRKVKLKRAGEQQTMDRDFLDSFNESFAVKDGSNPLSDLLATEKKNQTNATDKKEKQENKRRNTKPTKIERPNRAQAASPNGQKKDEKGTDSGVNIQELEAAVFGKKADKKQIKNNYSELQNAKAYLIVQIQDRLNEHSSIAPSSKEMIKTVSVSSIFPVLHCFVRSEG